MQILCVFFFFYSWAAVSVVFSTLLSCSGFIVCSLFASCIVIRTNKDDDTRASPNYRCSGNQNLGSAWCRCIRPIVHAEYAGRCYQQCSRQQPHRQTTHTVATTFLLRSHCVALPDMRRLSGDDYLCFNKTAPRRINKRHRRFPGARETREMRRRL